MKLTILLTASTTCFIFNTVLHNTSLCVIQCKNVNFGTGLVSVTLSCILFKIPTFLPVRFGQPVVTAASLSHFSPNMSNHAFTSPNKSLPVVVPFIYCMAANSSVIWKSAVIPRKKMSSWAVSRTSQLSSKAREKQSKSAALFFSWSSKFPAMSSIRLVTVRRESETLSNVPFFSRHISAAESNKHSLINSPSENGLLFLLILWGNAFQNKSKKWFLFNLWCLWLASRGPDKNVRHRMWLASRSCPGLQ